MKKGVLLINDSKFESLVMKDIICRLGYDVEITNEYNVIKKIHSFHPDIIIVNYIMEETTGDQIIYMIKKEEPTIKCLLSSSNPIEKNNFAKSLVDEVIHTPILGKDLEEILNRLEIHGHNFNYCPFCSHELKTTFQRDMIFCPYCGKELIIS